MCLSKRGKNFTIQFDTPTPQCLEAREVHMAKPIPDGYHTVTPYLIVIGGTDAIEFYKSAFGAIEHERMQDDSGKVRHAEISIGNSRIMLADEDPELGALSPTTIGGSPVSIHYVEDVDAVVANAVAAGAGLTRQVSDQFYGD